MTVKKFWPEIEKSHICHFSPPSPRRHRHLNIFQDSNKEIRYLQCLLCLVSSNFYLCFCLPMYTDQTLPLSFFCPLLFFLRNIFSMHYHPLINLCLCSSLQYIPVKFPSQFLTPFVNISYCFSVHYFIFLPLFFIV